MPAEEPTLHRTERVKKGAQLLLRDTPTRGRHRREGAQGLHRDVTPHRPDVACGPLAATGAAGDAGYYSPPPLQHPHPQRRTTSELPGFTPARADAVRKSMLMLRSSCGCIQPA